MAARRVAVAAGAGLILGLTSSPALATAEPVFSLAGSRAPAGMATDHQHDRYWVLASTSGKLTLHAYGADGTDEGYMNSRDYVTNVQAVAYVNGSAYVADSGSSRSQVEIYWVRAPWPGTEINHAKVYTFTYPDGSHRAKAILVDADHRISVVTSGTDAGIYQAPADATTGTTAALTRVADAPAEVTDGTVLRDGRIVLRTASTVYTLDPTTYETLGSADLELTENGMSVTESVAGASLLTGATGAQEVSESAVPGPAPATTAPSPEATEEAEDTESTEDAQPVVPQTGTRWALIAAGALAVLAALFALVKRR